MDRNDYPFKISKLSQDDGGGYFIEYPDLPGCFSDGETVEETIQNGRNAIDAWITTALENGDPIPSPTFHRDLENYSGRILQRFPKFIHKMLSDRAVEEGVSINTLITTFVAEGLHVDIGKSKKSKK